MNIGFYLCGVLVIPFAIIGVLFAIFKEKSAKLVSGFNSFSKEEQALYDKARIARINVMEANKDGLFKM